MHLNANSRFIVQGVFYHGKSHTQGEKHERRSHHDAERRTSMQFFELRGASRRRQLHGVVREVQDGAPRKIERLR